MYCAGCLLYYNNKLLMVKDVKGYLSPPKGKIEKNEDYLKAAKRELKEETGITDDEYILSDKYVIEYSKKNIPSTILYIGKLLVDRHFSSEDPDNDIVSVDLLSLSFIKDKVLEKRWIAISESYTIYKSRL